MPSRTWKLWPTAICTPRHAPRPILRQTSCASRGRSLVATSIPIAAVAALAIAALGLGGCSTNPATGKSQLAIISEAREIELGREADAQVRASLGVYPDPALNAYVERLGKKLAAASERPNLPWSFAVVDDPTVNAFALPGGFIYVTRGLLAHMTSEAELVSVLGHEIGHVTGRHSVEQMSRQQLAQIGLIAGAIASPEFAQYADVAQQGLGLLFLKYGRDDERQADDLGLRYLVAAAYDPREMPPVFATLKRVGEQASGGGGGGRVPNWLSTHPSEESRIQRIEQGIAALGRDFSGATVAREPYLAALEGLVFGEDPREGYFLGPRFIHPGLGFELTFPAGWATANQKQQVAAISPQKDAIVALTLARESSPEQAARAFFSQQGVTQGASLGSGLRGGFGGLPAVAHLFVAEQQSGNLNGVAAFVAHGGQVFNLLAYTGEGAWRGHSAAMSDAVSTFERVRDRRLLEVSPNRLEVVTLPSAMTLEDVARRYGSGTTPAELETLAILNQVQRNHTFPAGTQVKRVVPGQRPR